VLFVMGVFMRSWSVVLVLLAAAGVVGWVLQSRAAPGHAVEQPVDDDAPIPRAVGEPSPEPVAEPSPEPAASPVAAYGVSAGHPAAVEAGMGVLAAGGNAVDAAIATAYAVGVAEPFGSGIGGGGAALGVEQGQEPVPYD
jgi:gamma-glutamyltranspeptidase / glutathione hydrolase